MPNSAPRRPKVIETMDRLLADARWIDRFIGQETPGAVLRARIHDQVMAGPWAAHVARSLCEALGIVPMVTDEEEEDDE